MSHPVSAPPAAALDDVDAFARPNLFEIDLGAIAGFTRHMRRLIGDRVTLFAALKCNAYGFGLEPVARTVLAAGADALSMVDAAAAIRLRRAGITAPILLYPGAVAAPALVAAIERHDLIPTLLDLESAELFARCATRVLRVAVKLDVGQERLGIPAEAAAETVRRIAALPNLRLHVVNAHPNLPSGLPAGRAEDYLGWQLDRFEAACRAIEAAGVAIPIRLLASSKILAVTGRLTLQAVDPGQMYFGPLRAAGDVPWPTGRSAFRRLASRIIHVKALARDAWHDAAPFPVRPGMRMAVIPFGSSDGAARLHAGAALVCGRRAPVIAAPSLEHMRLDVTGIPEARVGDEVVLIGAQGDQAITPDEVVAYHDLPRFTELALAVGPGVPRRWLPAED